MLETISIFQFAEFRAVLDGELKHLNATGNLFTRRKPLLSLWRWRIYCGKGVFLEITHHKY